MDGDPTRETAKRASQPLKAPACIHLYVWVFMIGLSLSPALALLLTHGSVEHGNGLASLEAIGFLQVVLWMAQRRCSSEDLSYWEGLLVAAASVTTGENLPSLLRTSCLLLAVVIISIMFALDHDHRYVGRHAGLRFGRLIIWLHRQRWITRSCS